MLRREDFSYDRGLSVVRHTIPGHIMNNIYIDAYIFPLATMTMDRKYMEIYRNMLLMVVCCFDYTILHLKIEILIFVDLCSMSWRPSATQAEHGSIINPITGEEAG